MKVSGYEPSFYNEWPGKITQPFSFSPERKKLYQKVFRYLLVANATKIGVQRKRGNSR